MTTSLPDGIPATHPAIAAVGVRAPLAVIDRTTEAPGAGEILVHVEWTASSPLDLHQADGGLLVTHPYFMGTCYGGTVAALGPEGGPERSAGQQLKLGDQVFGFGFRNPREKGYQTYLTTSAFLASKLPPNLTLQEAVTVPTNLVTAFHTATNDLELELPWPRPAAWRSAHAEAPILVWGAASSVGHYSLQVLRHWGYENVLAVASGKHHEELKALGARMCFDYRQADVTDRILEFVGSGDKSGRQGPRVPYIVDCIGSLEGTLRPLTRIAESGSRVAIMLPVINVHASSDEQPEYEMDVTKSLVGEWADGVELKGTRTHHYLQVCIVHFPFTTL
jgi:NADPH:quinone reductase-like Zn-dependent oxidoreductase